jgi:hypothetical protein
MRVPPWVVNLRRLATSPSQHKYSEKGYLMTVTPVTVSSVRSKGFQAILFGGLIAGTLDLTAACISSWLRPGVGPLLAQLFKGLLQRCSHVNRLLHIHSPLEWFN